MLKKVTCAALILSTLFWSACRNHEAQVAKLPPPPSIAPDDRQSEAGNQNESAGFSSAAAEAGGVDSVKKFVRTADLKFRADNVLQTSLLALTHLWSLALLLGLGVWLYFRFKRFEDNKSKSAV
jgi:hypothetical protein